MVVVGTNNKILSRFFLITFSFVIGSRFFFASVTGMFTIPSCFCPRRTVLR